VLPEMSRIRTSAIRPTYPAGPLPARLPVSHDGQGILSLDAD